MQSLVLIAGLCSCMTVSLCFQRFQAEIPNGSKVPNPCGEGTWPGVGHKKIGGTGERNPFGQDFEANGETWSKTVCGLDSDGDGKTNGQELGDPDCVWTKGDQPHITTDISHPGICEPVDSHLCLEKNSWLTSCNSSFLCPALDLPTTQSIEVRLPRTKVPSKTTTYICIGHVLPNDTDYHAIGAKPLVDNALVAHHMIIYGCMHPLPPEKLTEPWECKMVVDSCQAFLALWAIGIPGQCNDDAFGIRIGPHGYQYIAIQVHWNNAGNLDDQYDSSGFEFFYTSQLRPNDGQILVVGQSYLNLPPNTERIETEGKCPAECSSLMTPPTVNITAAIFHAHYQGVSGEITLLRKDGTELTLVKEYNYDYNSPRLLSLAEHVAFNAGDEILIKCIYQTENVNHTIHWGEATQDEMCFGFILMYPAPPGFIACGQWKEDPVCTLFPEVLGFSCDRQTFLGTFMDPAFASNCNLQCSDECRQMFTSLESTGCLAMVKEAGQLTNVYWPFAHDAIQLQSYCSQIWMPTTMVGGTVMTGHSDVAAHTTAADHSINGAGSKMTNGPGGMTSSATMSDVTGVDSNGRPGTNVAVAFLILFIAYVVITAIGFALYALCTGRLQL